ncbi:MAG: hypothetical protein JXQ75_23175 [Phycisphaerae bacterium]|nr:hypothetical protein [Phycisphaerae bacterium]
MSRTRRGPNLFEVMSKAPQVQIPQQGRGLFGRRRKESASLVVAEPMTEEEAVAELAARRSAQEEAVRAKQARREARQAAKQAAKQLKQARKSSAATAAGAESSAGGPLMRFAGGRLMLSLNTVGCVVAGACICVLMIGAYSLGRRSVVGTPVAAVSSSASARTPLLSNGSGAAGGMHGAGFAEPSDPDLSELLKVHAARHASVVNPNQPANVASPASEDNVAASKLNYLQIESFRITRDRSGEQIKEDLAEVRSFLAERGVETFSRRLGNGYVLFGKQGFPPGPESEAQRDAFRSRIEDLGKQYRDAGGLYRFRDPLFVSYSQSMAGQPA